MSRVATRRVAVVGATSQIGRSLLPLLKGRGMETFPIGREPRADGAVATHVFDAGRQTFSPPLETVDAVISLAPLPTIGRIMEMAVCLGARRVIAFGSTGRFSKAGSTSPIERDFVEQQAHAEALFCSLSEAAGIAWTLFRPTMIYGAGTDLNVSFIAGTIRRFGFFPIPMGARGLRQPVHVDDLARACVAALDCSGSFDRTYDLGGGEVLEFPELVRRIFRAEGRRPLLIPLPLWAYRLAIAAARRYSKTGFVRKEMVDRMFRDLVADNGPAVRDFGYAPMSFDPARTWPDGDST